MPVERHCRRYIGAVIITQLKFLKFSLLFTKGNSLFLFFSVSEEERAHKIASGNMIKASRTDPDLQIWESLSSVFGLFL